MNSASTGLQLGRFGVWLNPLYGDDARTEYVIQAESLGFLTAWLGFGRGSISDLALVERVLDATATINVATAIVNMWNNDSADIVNAYHRIAVRHGDRFLLGVGVGHPVFDLRDVGDLDRMTLVGFDDDVAKFLDGLHAAARPQRDRRRTLIHAPAGNFDFARFSVQVPTTGSGDSAAPAAVPQPTAMMVPTTSIFKNSFMVLPC